MNPEAIYLGKGEKPQQLLTALANRHGLIAGATGTGKTVTLRILAEGFSRRGVPVFMADVKGDLSGLARAGKLRESFQQRAAELDYPDYQVEDFPVIFWDLFGEQGHPVRAVVQDMGPLLLSRLMELNEVQEGILNIAFSVSEDEDLPLLDFKDLRTLLADLSERRRELAARYGNISPQSVGAIQRRLLSLERQQAEKFFGEPELELQDLMRVDAQGRGVLGILAADQLIRKSPQLYAIFLMWLLSRLFEDLPERGDADKPKLVFIFDEAHLLFDGASKALVNRIEQVARLIRSKGVGVYFVTQSPSDIPDDVLGQLGNRIQHALRAFTPKDQKAVRAAARTFRENPDLDAEAAIKELAVGEALVSTLDEQGIPSMVERVRIVPPATRLGPLTPEERGEIQKSSPVAGKYEEALDRDSAHERVLAQRKAREEQEAAQAAAEAEAKAEAEAEKSQRRSSSGRRGDTVFETLGKSAARSVGSRLGRGLLDAVMKMFFKK